MKLVAGMVCIALGGAWIYRIATRSEKPRSPGQVALDFLTGAPRESIAAVSLLLLGCLLVAAAFVAA